MTTLKEFETALRERGLNMALAVLEKLRERDRSTRSMAPARRITGRKMTSELARRVLELHRTTSMTQQEIAFQLGVNQGRVNEVIKHGKWLDDNPDSAEAVARDKAVHRARTGVEKKARPGRPGQRPVEPSPSGTTRRRAKAAAQLTFSDF
jgi:hypothetical protein